MGSASLNQNESKILVVDDDRVHLESISKLLKLSNYKCITALTSNEALNMIKTEKPLVVLTDLRMENETSGIDLLEEVKRMDPDSVVLLYTAFGDISLVSEAFKKGAFDFIQKMQTHHDILVPIERALKYARMQRENNILRNRIDVTDDGTFFGAIGVSPAIRQIFDMAKRIAVTNATVMITGDTGTGKDVIARGIHHYSQREKASFVPVAIGSLPDALLESELFGYVKGAFTGATADKQGLFEAAHQGTMFLDEIGEVSMNMQHKLLRVLQDRKIRPVGSTRETDVDVRIISATNRDPDQLIEEKKLRDDLFFRLNVIRIHIPPLKDRREDIPILAYHFFKHFRKSIRSGVIPEKISNEALLCMQQYDWPGNVRELQGVMESMLALSNRAEIRVEDLPEKIRPKNKRVFIDANTNLDFKTAKERILEEFEKRYIEDLLVKCNYNICNAAKIIDLNRKTIYRLIEKHKINIKRMRAEK
jgi:two-component system, NtrC family, response regulator AtoC